MERQYRTNLYSQDMNHQWTWSTRAGRQFRLHMLGVELTII
jgi:hypothetical protein